MQHVINITEFIQQAEHVPIIDVRSPGEFAKAHIPNAINIPLFTDEERKIVGIRYKENGRDQAIFSGLDIVGPKLKLFIKQALKIAPDKNVLIYCWRGGMRSKSMAWLLDFYGFNVSILSGGYKKYRNYALKSFEKQAEIVILGGKTGSGKTIILNKLRKLGEQIIDLEKIANHKGSAFGSIGEKEQDSTEFFENKLFHEWNKLDFNKRVWLEDESHSIGRNFIPNALFDQMRNSRTIFIDISKELRIEYLVNEYAIFGNEVIENALKNINKRIGNNNYKTTLEALNNNNYKAVTDISLQYYDKAYLYGLSKRDQELVSKIEFNHMDFEIIAKKIIEIENQRV
ncbi:MAG TPA: tRNA 2-selenouridine(34) synthase MnmH [Bacteroidales bacterium]|nr:MAG: tRNA 2-selenouridine(34) synthase MnmH [Bacteroidetes bacterium GWF2_33_38]OFY85966.1 MAG: tRNA 2-selenouridine(34) synthase MnmH [Bacteroidetes bacterium RIFOXYA2_FULL_33_7]HBF88752.1 tRNA 2-selenouridine(34) synthase MnmH [Bacteroidales bacterium]